MKSALKFFVASLAFATASAHAVVGPSAYYDFTSFSSATLGGLGGSEFNFDSFNPPGGNVLPLGGSPVPVPGSGVSFEAADAFIADALLYGNPTIIYTAKVVTTFPNTITATLTGATAIGFYYGSYAYAGTPLTAIVTSSGIDSSPFALTLPSPSNTYNFVGFTSDATISKVVFTQDATDNALDIQRFYVGTIAAVPEPSAALMFGVGLALLGVIGSRRRA